jgi:transcription antitermination factor NusG
LLTKQLVYFVQFIRTGRFWAPACLRKENESLISETDVFTRDVGNQTQTLGFLQKSNLRGDGEAMLSMSTYNSHTALAPTLHDACWYAASTAPCREKRVLDHLAIRKIESFLPLYLSSRKWKNGCRVELERPLFPGYVFVRVAITDRVRVLEVPSVLSIVSRGRVPEPLEEHVIATLRASLHLRNIEPHPYLVIGNRVSIIDGPFAGLSGIVLRRKGSLHVVITVELLMQSVAVEVDIADLKPLHESSPL